ncbi:MAG: NYN domain-containing protein [Euryarchaeota archaeon]|nr:NYN domain-containing protein [Euryarchaeota archaeon]
MADADRDDRNVAILMDFENTKDANLQKILSHAAAYGQVIIRRAYADWTRHMNAQNRLRESGFEAVHQFTTGSGTKNATDINLTVECMDLLWSRPVDVFVLVTADSDFAKLAMRLREGGKQVIGIGAKARVGRALVQACDSYLYYSEGPEGKGRERGRSRERKGKEPKPKETAQPAAKKAAVLTDKHKVVLNSLEAAADEEGYVYGSPLHRSIKRLYPDFSYRDYGHGTFRAYIDSLSPVIHTETDPERSDFLVWIDEAYEDMAWETVEGEEPATPAAAAAEGVVLAEDVQDRINSDWARLAGKSGRLPASRAGKVVAEEYGVDRLQDTPLASLDAVLAAAPKLKKRWKREKNTMVRLS